MRDNQYTTEGRIRFSEVDHTRRITLPGIVNYFQDCSTFQSEDLGLGIMHCSERKRAWILSSWQVVVERYPEERRYRPVPGRQISRDCSGSVISA